MVMDAISPQSVGREFVRQYYTLLNKAPLHLHRFYSGNSSFVHGGLDEEDKTLEPVHGQQEIHQKIMQLNFRDCKAKIRQVDAHATLESGVVVQVLGELSNDHKPMRRFVQTFVLAPQAPKKYYVYNDIFRYQDEVFFEGDSEENHEAIMEGSTGVTTTATPPVDDDDLSAPPSDGIATVSIIDGRHHENAVVPHMNGGGSATPSADISPPRVPTEQPSIEPAPKPSTPPPTEQQQQQQAPVVVEEEQQPPLAKENSEAEPAHVSEEKPTYANLFKKPAGAGAASSTLVANSGPPSLPPSGFAKSSQQPSSSPPSSTTTTTAVKEGSPGSGGVGNSGFQSKGFRGGRGGGGGGNSGRGGGMSGRDRYHASRESVSSNANDELGQQQDKGRGSRMGGAAMNVPNYPDTQQVFVGNLPHDCLVSDLEELFSQFGKVVEVRINNKGVAQTKNLADSQKSVPNFGFVVFEDEKSAIECLKQKPVYLPNRHRLNVETKKKNHTFQNRDDRGYNNSSGGGNIRQNSGSGSNFDRESQESYGNLGRGGGGGGLNTNSGRGNSRGGQRGGGRGGFSGGRGHGPPPQAGPGGSGNMAVPSAGPVNSQQQQQQQQQRTTYTRRS